MKTQEWKIPIKLVSCANESEHWQSRRKRNRAQELAVKAHLRDTGVYIEPPCKITLVRRGKRILDYDNLVYAFKHIVDCLGQLLVPEKAKGQADSGKYFSIDYQQEKGDYAIKIKLEAI